MTIMNSFSSSLGPHHLLLGVLQLEPEDTKSLEQPHVFMVDESRQTSEPPPAPF